MTCTDAAGNSSSGAYLVKYDATPPAVSSATAERVPDSSGWYNHPVRIDWHGSDATSGGVSCSSLTYTGPDDANASKSGGCTDAAGNSSGNSLSFGLRYDSTPPATLGTPSPAPNAKGWLRSPVTVAWSGSDTTSGVASCSAPSGYSGPDTAGATLGGSCTDNAGNSSNGSYTVKYDTHPPATTAAPTTAPNPAGWFRTPVTISAGGTDSLSGVGSCGSTTYGGPDTSGTNTSVACTDNAGNSSSDAYLVKYDATPPAVSSATAERVPDSSGWYNHPVRIDWHGTDPISGVASCSSLTYAGPDDANASRSGGCTDVAGNSSGNSLSFGLRYDATPPLATVTAARPADHDGWYNHPVSISWSGTDATSGIDSCTAPLTYSGPDSGNASSVGHCTDHAGNTASPPALSFRYDATPPSATAVPSRPPDAGGWYNHRLTVDWSGSDPGLRNLVLQLLRLRRPGSRQAFSPAAAAPTRPAIPRLPPPSRSGSMPPRRRASPRRLPGRPTTTAGTTTRSPCSGRALTPFRGSPPAPRPNYGDAAAAGPAVLSGGCTDQAGNSSDPLAFDLDYDETPPVFARLALTALDGTVLLRWRVSGATHVSVSRSPGVGRATTSMLYDGSAAAFADRKAENYVRYRYVVTAEDAAGNTLRRIAVATPKPTLFAPRPGARLGAGSSPVFAWKPVAKARYYNLQLWLEGRQVGSWWPVASAPGAAVALAVRQRRPSTRAGRLRVVRLAGPRTDARRPLRPAARQEHVHCALTRSRRATAATAASRSAQTRSAT